MRTQEDARAANDQTPVWKRWTRFAAFEGKVRRIEEWMNLASVFIIMYLMFFATAEIVGRYLFNAPIPGHVEIVELIMAGIVFLGIAHTEHLGAHVRMELFITKVLRGRGYHIAEVVSILLSLFVYGFILVYSLKSTIFSFQMGDSTTYLYWPTWPSKLAIPVGSFFLCVRFLIEIIQHTAQVIEGVEMRDLL